MKHLQRMATKSLSALKSRKEEIIDHLEDLVGKEEAQVCSFIGIFLWSTDCRNDDEMTSQSDHHQHRQRVQPFDSSAGRNPAHHQEQGC